eukprot:12339002-Alexandrium_andersonii.AAC.1
MVDAQQAALAADAVARAAQDEATRAEATFWDGEEARWSRYQARAEQLAAREAESFSAHMDRAVATWRDAFAGEAAAAWALHDAEDGDAA